MNDSKLNVYTIILNRKKNKDKCCFKDLLISKHSYSNEEKGITPLKDIDKKSDSDLLGILLDDIIKLLDQKEFYSDNRTNKGIGIEKTTTDKKNYSIRLMSKKNIILGRLSGGKYGKFRKRSKVKDQSSKDPINPDDIILDEFFFLLYTPLEGHRGILMIQSYSDETINNTFKDLLYKVFNGYDTYHKAKVESFFPKTIKDKFKNTSKVKSISLSCISKNITIGSDNPETENTESYSVSIIITPPEKKNQNFIPKIPDIIKSILGSGGYKTENLKAKINLEDQRNKCASFELDKNINNIKPVIYLSNHIQFSDNITDNFKEIETYSLSLLDDIKTEIYGKGSNEAPLLSENGN